MTKKFPMLVVSPDEVEANVRTFAGAVEGSKTLQARLSNARAWYVIRDRNGRMQFAPSKWAGYSGITAADYVENARENMDGKQTENRLNQWFRPLTPGSAEHNNLLKELAVFTSRFGKQPSSACRIAMVDNKAGANEDDDPDALTDLIVRVARRLSASHRKHIRDALRE